MTEHSLVGLCPQGIAEVLPLPNTLGGDRSSIEEVPLTGGPAFEVVTDHDRTGPYRFVPGRCAVERLPPPASPRPTTPP